jgi:hypothetical protein
MKTAVIDVARFLEAQAKLGAPITYSAVTKKFPDLGELGPHWKSHPLCGIFGELDDEDHRKQRPFRTALVVGKESGRPGQGFFETVSNLRNQTILQSERDTVWAKEFETLIAYYA